MHLLEIISKHILFHHLLDEMCHPPWTWSPITNGRFECENVIETGPVFYAKHGQWAFLSQDNICVIAEKIITLFILNY